jgi:hypothetical protein
MINVSIYRVNAPHRAQQLQAPPRRPQPVVALRPGEAGDFHDERQAAGGVVADTVEAVEEGEREEASAHQRILRPAPVGDVEATAVAENPVGLGEAGALGVGIEVVQEQGHDQAIAAAVLERQRARQPRLPLDPAGARRGPGDRQDLWIPVDADHFGRRRRGGEGDREGARAGTDVGDPAALRQVGQNLRNEAAAKEPLPHRDRDDRVIEAGGTGGGE